MPSERSRVVIAAAGSGKTTFLVEESLSRPDYRTAILTYTNNNVNAIKAKLYEKFGGIPGNIDVMGWCGFLLRECARPYQKFVYPQKRIRTIAVSRMIATP